MPNEIDWICEVERQLQHIERFGADGSVHLDFVQQMIKDMGGSLDVKEEDNVSNVLYYITLLFMQNRYYKDEDYQYE